MQPYMKELERIFFPVWKAPANEDQDHSSWLTHEILVQPPGHKKPYRVNVCSADYNLVSNKTLILPIVEKLSTEFSDMRVTAVIRDWAQFYIDIRFEGKPLRGATKKDILYPRLRINNSYNGAVKFSFHSGFWRLICSNGAKAPVPDSIREGKFMHTPQLGEEGSNAAEIVLEKMVQFMEKSKELVRLYDPLIQHTLTESAAITRIAEVQENTSYPKKLGEKAMERLTHEAQALKQPINDYLVYNAMNFALYNTDESSLPEHKKDKKDQEVLDFLLAEN